MSDYAGDLSPQDSWSMLAEDSGAMLVDVRTAAEWQWVGQPDLSGLDRSHGRVEWVRSDGSPNESFVSDLRAAGASEGTPLLFLCRSGVRSIGAARAATEAGLGPAYNILEGFEGDPDDAGHRGTVGGWKVAGLPWRQN